MSHIVGPLRGVRAAEPVGNKGLNGFADEFIARIAEEPLHLGVYTNDFARLVRNDDGVRRELKESFEEGV
jgi:hypothetical protein